MPTKLLFFDLRSKAVVYCLNLKARICSQPVTIAFEKSSTFSLKITNYLRFTFPTPYSFSLDLFVFFICWIILSCCHSSFVVIQVSNMFIDLSYCWKFSVMFKYACGNNRLFFTINFQYSSLNLSLYTRSLGYDYVV